MTRYWKLTACSLALAAASMVTGACASAWIAHGADAPRALAEQRRMGEAWHPIEITARPLGQSEETGSAPAPLTLGPLKFAGALVLTSPSEYFGGFSGLRLSDDGTRLYALSDRAKWLRTDVTYNEYGAISDLTNASIANITYYGGEIITGVRADAEALELTPDGAILGFERSHRLDYYERQDDDTYKIRSGLLQGDLVSKLPENQSLESVAMLADGRIVTIAEGRMSQAEERVGWISPPDVLPGGTDDWAPFTYLPAEEFSPTDMVQAPEKSARLGGGDGDIYVVERAFSRTRGVRARLTRFPVADLTPGKLIEPEELARLTPLHGVDNMEGIDVRRLPDGRLMLYIISDDNFNLAQRSVLMSWEVTDR